MALRIDYANMMAPAVTGGITEEEWSSSFEAARLAFEQVAELRAAGTIGFLDLGSNSILQSQSQSYAASVALKHDDVVILGIGGSALGPTALRTALAAPGWNSLTRDERGGWPRLWVLDNIDPAIIAPFLDRLALPRSLFVVTSKSGGTAETMSQYLIVLQRLLDCGLDPASHVVFITDPEKGALRPLARSEGIAALDIPASVGGRFSILSPVGMLPAALIGIDIAGILAGAADMAARCGKADTRDNPALVYALAQWVSDKQHGRHVHVFMPYSDQLRDFAHWFVQLWAESLGKQRKGEGIGPTPLPALGATDQHSQMQLFMEGPADKTVTFVSVSDRGIDLEIPALHGDVTELGYLGGHSLGELIDVEQRASAGALAHRGRPNMTIHLDKVDAWHIGSMVMMLEIATAYAGALYGVDAFDQPGVELGKQYAYALLGRPGADEARREWESLPKSDPRWSL